MDPSNIDHNKFAGPTIESIDQLYEEPNEDLAELDESEVVIPPELSHLSLQAIAIVLVCCIDKLSVISAILPADPREEWRGNFEYDPLMARYGGPRIPNLVLPEAQGLQHLTEMQKLQRDLCKIIQTMTTIVHGIQLDFKFNRLFSTVNVLDRLHNDEEMLIRECQENIAMVRKLNTTYQEEQRASIAQVKVLNERMYNLDNEVHDATLKVDITRRFGFHWEDTRLFQNSLRLKQQEEDTENEIRKADEAIVNEKRVHDEIQRYILLNQTMMNDAIEEWMHKYDEDTEKVDNSIRELEGRRAAQHKAYKKLKAEMERRVREMSEWVADRDERARQAAELARLNMLAIKIQAWWRGIMVRQCKGQFAYLRKLYIKRATKRKAAGKKK